MNKQQTIQVFELKIETKNTVKNLHYQFYSFFVMRKTLCENHSEQT